MAEQVGIPHGPIGRDDIFLDRKKDPLASSPTASVQSGGTSRTRGVAAEPLPTASGRDDAARATEERGDWIPSAVRVHRDFLQRQQQEERSWRSDRYERFVGDWSHGHFATAEPGSEQSAEQRSVVREPEHGGIFTRMLNALRLGRAPSSESKSPEMDYISLVPGSIHTYSSRDLPNASLRSMGSFWRGYGCRHCGQIFSEAAIVAMDYTELDRHRGFLDWLGEGRPWD